MCMYIKSKSCILILLGIWRDFGGYDVWSCDGCCNIFVVLSLSLILIILCLCISRFMYTMNFIQFYLSNFHDTLKTLIKCSKRYYSNVEVTLSHYAK